MIIQSFALGPLETNCYLVACPETREAAVIDPAENSLSLLDRIEKLSLNLSWILITHGHGDHILGVGELKQIFPGAVVAVHEADARHLTDPLLNLSGLFGAPFTVAPAERLLKDGDVIPVGNLRLRVIGVPGHTPGGAAFYSESGTDGRPVLFGGDALFASSVGRSDFPGGDQQQLIEAIKSRLLILPPDTVVYPGHGPLTTIGREARENPFL